jgi:hypothetical protein
MTRRWIVLTLAVFPIAVSLLHADDLSRRPAKPIDLVLCLDTSNSMDGLIDSAKRKLWDIVNDLGRAKPTPRLRVALYSYGNTGYDQSRGWVRQEVPLTTDLDKVSEKLFALTTNGGDEYVGRVSQAALRELDWAKEPGAFKVMFVCGNEPADQDREVKLAPLAETAVRQGVTINTIYCGPANHSETAGWKFLAERAEGRFLSINQDSRVTITTPQDARLAELSGKLNRTYLFYGKDAPARALNQEAQDANAAGLSLATSAGRALTKSSGNYRMAESDLVDKLQEDPKFDLSKVPEAELPEEMRKMTVEERRSHITAKLKERQTIQDEIKKLSRERAEYLAAEEKKQASSADRSLDQAMRSALREQAAKKGLTIND